MLGNGYCTRPVEVDCHFEPICESCTLFITVIEFRSNLQLQLQLQLQRDDSAAKGQVSPEQMLETPPPT